MNHSKWKVKLFPGAQKAAFDGWPKKQAAATVEICLIIKAHPRKLDEASNERYLWAGDGKAEETLMPILPAFFLNLNVFTYNNTITVLFLWPTRHSCFAHSLKIQNDCGIDFFFLPRKTFYISTRDLFVCWRKAGKRFSLPPPPTPRVGSRVQSLAQSVLKLFSLAIEFSGLFFVRFSQCVHKTGFDGETFDLRNHRWEGNQSHFDCLSLISLWNVYEFKSVFKGAHSWSAKFEKIILRLSCWKLSKSWENISIKFF